MRREREAIDGGGLHEAATSDLLRALIREGQGLVREEVRLARADIRGEANRARRWAGLLGAGGAVAHAALLLLGATLVLVGATFLQAWLSALAVTALYAIAAGILLIQGARELRKARPSRAVENLKEDGRWAQETMRELRSSRSANA
jgi:hypothetical protein